MKKKGFTLIELLAVIVILAILALILTPVINNVIGKAKLSAAERSTEGYIKAINFAAGQYDTEHDGVAPTSFEQIKDLVNASSAPTSIISVTLDPSTGNVLTAKFRINNVYNCSYDHEVTKCEAGDPLKQITIASTYTFSYEEGMTWQQCIDAGYCSSILEIDSRDGHVRIKSDLVGGDTDSHFINEQAINRTNYPSDLIDSKKTYILGNIVCFVPGTKVLTKDGLVNIEDIQEGTFVYSYNEETNEYSYNKVLVVHKNTTMKDKTTVTVDGNEITSTSEHNYYTTNRGWVAAKNLELEDTLLLSNGKAGYIDRVETTSSSELYDVYNLTVENSHTFFVGDESVLVHNAGAPTGC